MSEIAQRLTLIKTWFWNIYAVVRAVATYDGCNINLERQPKGSLARLALKEKEFGF